LPGVTALNDHLVQIEADGDAIAGISTVVQIISITVVVHVDVIAVVPIAGPVFWPRVNQTEPIAAILETAVAANIHHGETVDAEPVILAIVGTETVIGNAVAVVTAALLPGAVLRLPAMCTITLPSDLLDVHLSRGASLCGPGVLLLTLLALLILPPSGLLLLLLLALLILLPFGLLLLLLLALLILPPSGLLLLLLLALLILLPSGLLLLLLLALLILLPSGLLPLLLPLLPPGLLFLFCRVVPLLTLLALLILLSSGLLLLFRGVVLLLMLLPRLILLPIGLRLVLSCRPGLLLLLLLILRFILLLLA
jgi:hypothetical protein